MNKDNEALAALKEKLNNGSTYFEARTDLINNGFTELAVNNATAALKSGKDEIKDNPKLAAAIVQAEGIKAKDAEENRQNQETRVFNNFPQSGFYRMSGYAYKFWTVVFLVVAIIIVLIKLFV